jgi:hypothetical protein
MKTYFFRLQLTFLIGFPIDCLWCKKGIIDTDLKLGFVFPTIFVFSAYWIALFLVSKSMRCFRPHLAKNEFFEIRFYYSRNKYGIGQITTIYFLVHEECFKIFIGNSIFGCMQHVPLIIDWFNSSSGYKSTNGNCFSLSKKIIRPLCP